MTGLLAAIVIAAAAAAVVGWSAGRRFLGVILAVLALALAGYSWQGSPWLPGRPTRSIEQRTAATPPPAEDRAQWMSGLGEDGRWLVLADSYGREGDARSAAQIIQNGLRKYPRSPLLWLALGNSLVMQADGLISPAAELAFDRSARLDPKSPAPPLFHALALAQSGRLGEAEAMLAALVQRTPPDAPWRADLQQRLAAIRSLEAR